MKTVRLTMAQALVRYLMAQRTEIDGERGAAVPGRVRDLRPRQRHLPRRGAGGGQGRAADLARAERAVDGAGRDRLRQGQGGAGRSWSRPASIGPGATNMVTAAGVAHANRLPVLLLAGDNFANRLPDPVLQQVEHFGDPTITRQRRLQAGHPLLGPDHPSRADHLHRCRRRSACMLDPADCGPAFLGLCQDVQERPSTIPSAFFAPTRPSHPAAAPRPRQLAEAAALLRDGEEAADHRRRRRALLAAPRRRWPPSPSATASRWPRPSPASACWSTTIRCNVGPIGVIGSTSANALAGRGRRGAGGRHPAAGLHHRLLDACSPTTPGSSRINAARFDATKHRALPVVGDALARRSSRARRGARRLAGARRLDGRARATRIRRVERAASTSAAGRPTPSCRPTPRSSARCNRLRRPDATSRSPPPAACRASSCKNWRVEGARHLRLRVRLLLHGLRDRRRLGRARWPTRRATSIVMVGDGTYLMMNSDIYSLGARPATS